ncbi:hypothetical protein TNCV_4662171 [Trichonephila clavipes]|uniref:Uncharacterized protein n=1 Tax=Trichonephila clavipes TaxID=2585209 RepID=A0A8X6S9K9_TRICX|nr:hypothetical protein TNCV_4662171 [Trichonephila clavipes]
MNERIALEEEMRLKKERWLVKEQMRHVQEEYKMRMKEEQKCFLEERYAVAQLVTVEEEKGLSRDSSNVPPISAEDETYGGKEETPVDVIKDKGKGDINHVIHSKERVDLDNDKIEEEKSNLPNR